MNLDQNIIALRIFVITVFLFACSEFHGQNLMEDRSQAPMDEGYELLEARRYVEAEIFFLNFIGVHDKTARICHGRAIGLGGRHLEACELFITLNKDYPDDLEVMLNLAEAYLWNNKPHAAIAIYEVLLKSHSDNYVANLGNGNAHAAIKDLDKALYFVEKALALDPGASSARNSSKHIMIAQAYDSYKNGAILDAMTWIGKVLRIEPNNSQAISIAELIKEDARTLFQISYRHSEDGGGNQTNEKSLQALFNLSGRHKFSIRAGLLESASFGQEAAKQQSFLLSDRITLNKVFRLSLGAGIVASKSNDIKIERTLLDMGLEMFFSDRLYTKMAYSSEVHNYTKDLIEKDILIRHLSLSNNFMITPKLGLYTSGQFSVQSDENSRSLFYGSLYYSLVRDPLVRIGFNYNYFGFEELRLNYFSPGSYQLGEFFMMISNQESNDKLTYKLQINSGLQIVDEQNSQRVSRVEAMVGYTFRSGIFMNANYLSNSAAAATAIGEYSYLEWLVTLGYKF